jgi:hypothetical protein
LRVEACVAQLPEMRKTVASLLKRMEKLEEKIKEEARSKETGVRIQNKEDRI